MDLEKIIQDYKSLELDKVINHQKFSEYALTHHSTSIEGSTLTEQDTQLLLDEGITPKGKPLEHSLMVKDHYEALLFVIASAKKKQAITIEFIQTIAGKVLKRTGKNYNILEIIDASKTEFRKGNVTAGGSYFPNYDKVENLTRQLIEHLQKEMKTAKTIIQSVELANAAHFDLVSIHPFYDGNGRTSRLLMNYIQAYYDLPLGTVFKEDRAEYFNALTEARKQENITIFQDFMKGQYKKLLDNEIREYRKMEEGKDVPLKKGRDKGFSMFL